LLHLVGYLHRCTKMMHGETNIKWPVFRVTNCKRKRRDNEQNWAQSTEPCDHAM